jgi:hypothetical protein
MSGNLRGLGRVVVTLPPFPSMMASTRESSHAPPPEPPSFWPLPRCLTTRPYLLLSSHRVSLAPSIGVSERGLLSVGSGWVNGAGLLSSANKLIICRMSHLDQHRTVRPYWVRLGSSYTPSMRHSWSKPKGLVIVGIVIHRGQRRIAICPP